jgi:hypothetical protein
MSLINRLKPFAYGIVIAEIIASTFAKISFSGAIDTAETKNEV